MGRRTIRGGGGDSFELRYAGLFGQRWPALRAALLAEADSVPFLAAPGAEPYYLDAASVLAAEALDSPAVGAGEEKEEILDACAAPGGKSLVIASRMGGGASLVANELSSDRRRRLSAVLDRHLPPGLRARVRVAGEDAAAMCRRNEGRFAAILLDAPCSSERHVLADPRALGAWSPARPRELARRQWSLLSSAFLMLAPGGTLVYSTCALDPAENDGVARRLLAKYGDRLELDPPLHPRAERTEFGVMFLPDSAGGAGPMYLCRVRERGGSGGD